MFQKFLSIIITILYLYVICQCWSSGLQLRVDLWVDTNVLEEHTASVFNPEDRRNMFLQNVSIFLQVHAVLQPSRITSASSMLLDTQISGFLI
jgi:hypothetical protein